MLIAVSFTGVLGAAIGYLFWTGVGVWGNNSPVMWAWDITNFVWWIGIGHAGTLISAVLFLFRQKWRTGINRFAEAKENMKRGREMAWLRIERYWEGEGEELETRFLPMMCQHCGDAPCEPVCPVFATYHNPEGLNIQVYNRCVGTRYCQNNCPYRVRAFDYFDYDFPEPLNLQLNPDVTVRTKGVMEKCTFCSQRIREAKDRAQDEKRLVQDGEITPACAQTCPTGAIVFGDLNDKNSKVSQLARQKRSYGVLEELNTKPAVSYLRKVVRDQAKA